MTTENLLNQYAKLFPQCDAIVRSLPDFFSRKLWNELTNACLSFIFHPTVKGKIPFKFYTQFVKRFQKNIDQINLLKIIRETLTQLKNEQIIQFLKNYQIQVSNPESKILITSFIGYYTVFNDLQAAWIIIQQIKKYIDSSKDVDTFLYSSYYKLCLTYYSHKRKYKLFYTSALQYLAYTQAQQMQQKQKTTLLYQMGIAVLISDQIYNFSQLLEQPLLIQLKQSQYSWLFDLIQIFNKGDIKRFSQFKLQQAQLVNHKNQLNQKIRLMAFLELSFNLSKSNRVVDFTQVSKKTGVQVNDVQRMVMKSMALRLVRGSIDQIKQTITISWVAPKVLEKQRVSTMLTKFQEWQQGVKNVQQLVKAIKV